MNPLNLAAVLRALALVTATAATAACRNSAAVRADHPPQPESPPRAGACPASNPSHQTPCAEFAAGLNCEWYGVIQCTCQAATATTPTQQWSCVTRSVPGPLPPPELLDATQLTEMFS